MAIMRLHDHCGAHRTRLCAPQRLAWLAPPLLARQAPSLPRLAMERCDDCASAHPWEHTRRRCRILLRILLCDGQSIHSARLCQRFLTAPLIRLFHCLLHAPDVLFITDTVVALVPIRRGCCVYRSFSIPPPARRAPGAVLWLLEYAHQSTRSSPDETATTPPCLVAHSAVPPALRLVPGL